MNGAPDSSRARPSGPSPFWLAWLQAVVAALMAMGLGAVLLPDLALWGMSLLVYADPGRLDRMGAEAVAYLSFAHAVLGAVMFGWAVALLQSVRGPLAAGSRRAWWTVALSVAAWFVPGTLYSLRAGVWLNVALNLAFLVAFALPLAATRGSCRD
ncbi:hypothetical protein [Azohydromonas caseinilytica]|uniref:SPW repeat-containing protein n=1 Tax=Azohydromonas caseinilytica TaxID=2728836 RepID=A0A848FK50_9BURK|nr:hypothetical protein [Azohydromonas caseinilytica]NML18613.1 hypothetical protein [Azohydromonas caseinilytica]